MSERLLEEAGSDQSCPYFMTPCSRQKITGRPDHDYILRRRLTLDSCRTRLAKLEIAFVHKSNAGTYLHADTFSIGAPLLHIEVAQASIGVHNEHFLHRRRRGRRTIRCRLLWSARLKATSGFRSPGRMRSNIKLREAALRRLRPIRCDQTISWRPGTIGQTTRQCQSIGPST